MADVILPFLLRREDGTFTNTDQRVQHAAPPCRQSATRGPNWDILSDLDAGLENAAGHQDVGRIRPR